MSEDPKAILSAGKADAAYFLWKAAIVLFQTILRPVGTARPGRTRRVPEGRDE